MGRGLGVFRYTLTTVLQREKASVCVVKVVRGRTQVVEHGEGGRRRSEGPQSLPWLDPRVSSPKGSGQWRKEWVEVPLGLGELRWTLCCSDM